MLNSRQIFGHATFHDSNSSQLESEMPFRRVRLLRTHFILNWWCLSYTQTASFTELLQYGTSSSRGCFFNYYTHDHIMSRFHYYLLSKFLADLRRRRSRRRRRRKRRRKGFDNSATLPFSQKGVNNRDLVKILWRTADIKIIRKNFFFDSARITFYRISTLVFFFLKRWAWCNV